MKDYYELGKTFSNTVINNDKIKNLYDACIKHSDFIFIEIRSYKNECDTIILESCNDQVSSRNNVGIKNRERIAIIY